MDEAPTGLLGWIVVLFAWAIPAAVGLIFILGILGILFVEILGLYGTFMVLLFMIMMAIYPDDEEDEISELRRQEIAELRRQEIAYQSFMSMLGGKKKGFLRSLFTIEPNDYEDSDL